MPIYDKPTKELMRQFVAQELKPGQVFQKNDAVKWFRAARVLRPAKSERAHLSSGGCVVIPLAGRGRACSVKVQVRPPYRTFVFCASRRK
jgi:hypothetical protein